MRRVYRATNAVHCKLWISKELENHVVSNGKTGKDLIIHILVGILQRNRANSVDGYIDKERQEERGGDFKKLTHVTVKADKFKICIIHRQTKNPAKS